MVTLPEMERDLALATRTFGGGPDVFIRRIAVRERTLWHMKPDPAKVSSTDSIRPL